MNAAAALRAVDRRLLGLQRLVLQVGVLGIAAIGIANVLARNLLGGGLAFAEEVSQSLMVWITFSGLGLAARRARHIRMAAFYDPLRGRSRKLAWTFVAGGTSGLLAILAWLALRYLTATWSIGGVTPALRVPLWIGYSVVPIGLALGAVEYALTFVRNLTAEGIHASFDLREGEEESETPG